MPLRGLNRTGGDAGTDAWSLRSGVVLAGVVVPIVASLLSGCTVSSEDGPLTPTLTREPEAEVTVEGMAESVIVEGWACYSIDVDGEQVHLIAGRAMSSEPDADYLVSEAKFGALPVGYTWRVTGEYVSGEEADAARGACALAESYLAIADGAAEGYEE